MLLARPINYTLHLIPFIIPDNFTIAGHVGISINVSAPTDNITLHIYDMTVHEGEVVVSGPDGAGLQVAGHGYDAARQFYIVKLEEILQPGIVQVNISNDTANPHLLSIGR